jgi:hypothetical protein
MNMSRKIIGIFVCILMITVAYPVVGAGSPFGGTFDDLIPHHTLVRVTTGSGVPVLPKNIEIASDNPGAWVDVIIPSNRLHELSEMNVPYSVLIDDLEAYDTVMAGSYHSLAQIQTILEGIASNYSDIATLYSIGTTYEGRSIWCLEISDNPGVDEGEPGVFYMGVHHAREWPGAEICLHIANNLTSLYGVNSTITDLVNNRRIWIVPVTNADGYYYCHDQGVDWRKNRDYFPQYGSYGVDTNRNYNGSCDGNILGSWGSIPSWANSHDPENECYCGPGPTSEAEDQAVTSMFLNNNISATISFHTYGEEVMWPWGYTGTQTPDNAYLTSVGQQIAQRITCQSGSGSYDPHQSYGLYATVGDTIDYAYGYAYYVQGRATFAYTIEACSDFHPSASYLNQICKENCDGALYLIQEAQNIRDTVVPRVIPPVITTMPNDTDGNYRVSWTLQNPNANPDSFQLSEMKNLSLATDGAESGSAFWKLEGFTVSTSRFHSGATSFKSHTGDYDVSAMTTRTPVPITAGMTLSFWCWYAIQQNYDYAYVEVSENGRNYHLLDSITGTSSGSWVHKEYSLDNFTGKSLFIRFRYATDGYGHQEGFYVDDISPIGVFGSTSILSSIITNPYYDITGKPFGTYYYSVRGHNTVRGWCDNSTLEIINVTHGGGSTTPVIILGNFTASPGKVSMAVKNIGDANATSVNVTLRVTGGIFSRINVETTKVIRIAIGQEKTVTTDGYILGFGKITLSASASCTEAVPPQVTKNATGKILLLFIYGIQN